jgi:hypothetical protein
MKKVFLLLFLCSSVLSNAQNYNWITPNKDYLKLYIVENGIYRINKIDFINAGANTASIDPRTVKVFYKGSQIPIYFYGESDGVFNDSDYFDFYGQRNYGGLTNTYKDVNGSMVVDYVTDEHFNLYSDTSVYWVGWDGTNGLRFNDYNYSSNISYPQNCFFSNLHFEKDLIYSPGEIRNANTDYRYFNNEKVSGEGWYLTQLSKGTYNSISDTFSIPYLSDIPQTCSMKLFAYPNNYSALEPIFNEHWLIIKINSTIIDTLYRDDYNRFDTTIYFQSTLLSSTARNQVTITYTNPQGSPFIGNLYFDFFTINYPRNFTFDNNLISIKNNSSDTVSKKYRINGFNSSNETNIYDIKYGYKISNSSVSSDSLIFTGKGDGNFEIINKYNTKKPFRLKKRQVPNLASNSNGADYLVVYNKLFEDQAEQLRSHRASFDNFRAVKSEIEDIYDIFNYGIENPVAVKNFVKYAYNTWQIPRVKYVCLFGRGSIDPKKNNSSSYFYHNFVPVYGNPISDGYFVNMNNGTFTYYQQIAVGRLPAYTVQEAQDMVNKIINYDANFLDVWLKKFVFITGGYDLGQQQLFINESDTHINNYILPPPISKLLPISGYPIRIYRRDTTSGQITLRYQDSIKNSINNGSLIVNFIGHASYGNWDNGLEDPSIIQNGTKMPLILSMSCFTGKNAETDFISGRSFGEKFITLPGRGAIGFIGTTGQSFITHGNIFNDYLFFGFAKDSLRRMGDILKYASVTMSKDSLDFFYRNTLNCYNLMGDPALKLLLPTNPEFDIQMSDYFFSNPYPALKENIKLSIYPKNLGTLADSCKIRFQLIKNNQSNKIKDTIVRTFEFIDTLKYNFSIDSAGNYSMKIILDPDNWYPPDIKSNNSITIPITLRNISFVPLKPIDNTVIKRDTVEFTGLNPNINLQSNFVKLLLQIDTTNSFNSPLVQTFFRTNISEILTKFDVHIPVLDSNIVYYWKMNAIINNTDTSGWSETRRFTYNPLINPVTNSVSLFAKNIKSSERSTRLVNDSVVTIYKKKKGQYNQSDFINVSYDSDSIKLNKFTGTLKAQSWGGNPWDPSYFYINNAQIILSDSLNNWGGLNFAKIRKLDGAILEFKHIKFTSTTSSDSVVNYLNTFTDKHILMIVKSIPIGTTDSLRINARNILKQLGSIYADSVKINSYDRWCFISYNSSPILNVSEGFIRNNPNFWTPILSSMSAQFQNDSGSIVHYFGISQNWKNFSWNQIIYPNSFLNFDVYGIDKNSQDILLYSNLTNNSLISLDTLNSITYPNLKLITKFKIDTLNGTLSPILNSIKFNYIAPPEIVPDNNSFSKSDSVLQEGDTLRASLNIYNAGFAIAGGLINKWSVSSPNGIKILKVDSTYLSIPVDSSVISTVLINTAGLRKQQNRKDTIYLYFDTKLMDNQNEIFTYNNSAVTKFILTGDSIGPSLDITYDGIKVQSGDFIQKNPQIVLKYLDESKIVIRADSNIQITLDDSLISYFPNGIPNPDIQIIYPENKFLRATVIYKPMLIEGEHRFKFVAYDKSANSDTTKYTLTVSSDFKISGLTNYPNPMKGFTTFLFNLSGCNTPSSCKIKIYTVAGRLIKEINTSANIGYNQIQWDGRDSDGDYMANGVYLYKLIIEGDNKKESSIQKLAILK